MLLFFLLLLNRSNPSFFLLLDRLDSSISLLANRLEPYFSAGLITLLTSDSLEAYFFRFQTTRNHVVRIWTVSYCRLETLLGELLDHILLQHLPASSVLSSPWHVANAS